MSSDAPFNSSDMQMSDAGPNGHRVGLHRQPLVPRRRQAWWISAAAVGAAVTLALTVFFGTHSGNDSAASALAAPTHDAVFAAPAVSLPPLPAETPAPQGPALAAGFTNFESSLNARIGIAIAAVGSTDAPVLLGEWQSGPAWSTIKVPLVLAASRQADPPEVTDTMMAAITKSDNAAAESIWANLGDPLTAAQKVESVLRQTGDPTAVVFQQVRPPYTAFGQTDWSLAHQVQFISSAACNSADEPVLALMGQIEASQSWGMGTIPDTLFKGGWGPLITEKYVVRQFGVVTTPSGKIAIAMAAEPASGQFEDGTASLNDMASWLRSHLEELPTGRCPSADRN